MIVQFRITLNRLVRTKSLAQLALAELAPVIDHLETRGKENPEGQANTFMVAIDAFLKSEQSPYSPVVIED